MKRMERMGKDEKMKMGAQHSCGRGLPNRTNPIKVFIRFIR